MPYLSIVPPVSLDQMKLAMFKERGQINAYELRTSYINGCLSRVPDDILNDATFRLTNEEEKMLEGSYRFGGEHSKRLSEYFEKEGYSISHFFAEMTGPVNHDADDFCNICNILLSFVVGGMQVNIIFVEALDDDDDAYILPLAAKFCDFDPEDPFNFARSHDWDCLDYVTDETAYGEEYPVSCMFKDEYDWKCDDLPAELKLRRDESLTKMILNTFKMVLFKRNVTSLTEK
jgi:hypothetical protein